MLRTYEELNSIERYEDRYEYLKLNGTVGEITFGYDRWLNQVLYHLPEWQAARIKVISRDEGNDMGHPDHPIAGRVIIHHMNPVTRVQIIDKDPILMDPQYLICVSDSTHRAIHYGDENQIDKPFTERKPGDTKLW